MTYNSAQRFACVSNCLETMTHIHQPGDTNLASPIPTHSPACPHLRRGIRRFSGAPVQPAVQTLPWAGGRAARGLPPAGSTNHPGEPAALSYWEPTPPDGSGLPRARPPRDGRRQRARSQPAGGGRAAPGWDCDMAGAQPVAPRAQPSGGAAMERQELAGGAEPGASPDGEFQAVVQRTQVLLLAGETWEPDGAQAALSSFAHQVLPVARRSGSLSPAPPSPAPPAGQLIFFLCRAASLRGRAERLREALRGVREQSRGAPAALVAVIVQPQPEEEAEARRRLEELLLEVFQPPGPGAAPRVEVHTAVFRPGRPEGALEVKKAACEALREEPDAVWVSRATLFKVLGALCVACAGIIGSQYMNTSI
ncbi:uncharacterized protein LOC123353137 isoform X2 [Mauremys mutica]|uniref:uncharacterized protein LOC123353137 isoform X2 n=1 Tax=Mauremys mutica TaxID=74926 RepID=UPI001D160B0D|nr:uncharacterized protein LOC123353137 isoform X2 [Mauremys mutica]